MKNILISASLFIGTFCYSQRDYGEYVSPYNIPLIQQTLKVKQQAYNRNSKIVMDEIQSIENMFYRILIVNKDDENVRKNSQQLYNEYSRFNTGSKSILQGDFGDYAFAKEAYDWVYYFNRYRSFE